MKMMMLWENQMGRKFNRPKMTFLARKSRHQLRRLEERQSVGELEHGTNGQIYPKRFGVRSIEENRTLTLLYKRTVKRLSMGLTCNKPSPPISPSCSLKIPTPSRPYSSSRTRCLFSVWVLPRKKLSLWLSSLTTTGWIFLHWTTYCPVKRPRVRKTSVSAICLSNG